MARGSTLLLQNYWMQIHPPIVFIGFAAACIPFAFAMASLATNKYDNWVRQTMPWAVFSVVTLGLGIFLGGYWAYETLGWGGYWGWDPVENASFIPWLTGIALVHGMVIEKARGSWRRTNLFLAITTFVLIIFGTFLTRSGVLADFSVHAFTDLGYNNILLSSLLILGFVSYGLWIYRSSKMKVSPASTEILTQEFATFLSMVLLLPFTLLVLIWTSFPLITTALSKISLFSKISPSAVATTNYNMAGLVFGIIYAIILGFNCLLEWKKTEKSVFLKKLIIPSIISIVTALIFVFSAYSHIVLMWSTPEVSGTTFMTIIIAILSFLFFAASMFSLISSTIFLLKRIKSNFITSGGYFAHVGFSILLLGIISSGLFSSQKKVTMAEGGSGSALGYDVKFLKTESANPKEEQSFFEITKDGKTFPAVTTSKQMNQGNQIQYVRVPFIRKSLGYDFYLSLENLTGQSENQTFPVDIGLRDTAQIGSYKIIFEKYDSEENAKLLAKSQAQVFEIKKGEKISIGKQNITFEKFDMTKHQEGKAATIGAILTVEFKGKSSTITPTYDPTSQEEVQSEPVELPGGGFVTLSKIKADIGGIDLTYSPTEKASDVKVGTVLKIISDSDTLKAVPIHSPTEMHNFRSIVKLPKDDQLFLVDLNPKANIANFVYIPARQAQLATIEVMTKPMINLVWLGFLILVIGAGIAVFRRMEESKKRS